MNVPSMAAPKSISASRVECLGTRWRVRARRSQRGSMFIEAMSTLLTTAILLACVARFHSVYRTAGEALAASRLAAQERAYGGCELEAAEKVRQMIGQGTSRAPGIGAFPTALRHDVRMSFACNEPRARDEPHLAQVLDSLSELVKLQPVRMLTWFSGATQLFPGMSSALDFVTTGVSSFSAQVSGARDFLAGRLGDVLAWTHEVVAGVFDWVASSF
jgi:hypothetical protein